VGVEQFDPKPHSNNARLSKKFRGQRSMKRIGFETVPFNTNMGES
jgi:hypothetical protein